MSEPSDTPLTHSSTPDTNSCSLISIIPTLGMSSCRGRAEAFARSLSSKLRTLGSQTDEDEDDDEEQHTLQKNVTVTNGSGSSTALVDVAATGTGTATGKGTATATTSTAATSSTAVVATHDEVDSAANNNTWLRCEQAFEQKSVTDLQPLRHDNTDTFFDFDCELESPGSPVDECEYLRLIETASNTPHNSASESGFVCASTASSNGSTEPDLPYYDVVNNTDELQQQQQQQININKFNGSMNNIDNAQDLKVNLMLTLKDEPPHGMSLERAVNNIMQDQVLQELQQISATKTITTTTIGTIATTTTTTKAEYIKITKEEQEQEEEKYNSLNGHDNNNIDNDDQLKVNNNNTKLCLPYKEEPLKTELSEENNVDQKQQLNDYKVVEEEEKGKEKDKNKKKTETETIENEINKTRSNNFTHSGIDTTDDEDECRPQRVRRCSSLKTGKTPPGTPGRKKIVRFADKLGLDLADIKTFLDEIPNIPKSAFEDLQINDTEPPIQLGPKSDKLLVPLFQQPGGLSTFLDLVRERQVSLENAAVTDHINQTITGSVRVRNLDFHKSVHIRYTLDHWRSYADLQANYVQNSCDGFSDKFTFILFGNSMQVGQRLEFAVRFQCKGQQFWDNNYGINYCFQCLPASNTITMAAAAAAVAATTITTTTNTTAAILTTHNNHNPNNNNYDNNNHHHHHNNQQHNNHHQQQQQQQQQQQCNDHNNINNNNISMQQVTGVSSSSLVMGVQHKPHNGMDQNHSNVLRLLSPNAGEAWCTSFY